MKIWTFNTDTCRFDRAGRAALRDAVLAVVNDDIDLQVISEEHASKPWPSGEQLVVAGIEFDREQFE